MFNKAKTATLLIECADRNINIKESRFDFITRKRCVEALLLCNQDEDLLPELTDIKSIELTLNRKEVKK